MSLNNNQIPVYSITPFTDVAVLSAATAGVMGTDTNGQVICTGSTNGSRVYGLFGNTTDTAANNLFIYIKSTNGILKPLGQVNIPLSSGNLASTLNVDCMDPTVLKGLPVDNTGKRYIELAANDQLKCSVVANMTAAKNCYVTAMGAHYA
jgi:hypothetical protein